MPDSPIFRSRPDRLAKLMALDEQPDSRDSATIVPGGAAAPKPDLAPSEAHTVFGEVPNCRIVREISRGGQAVVYEAVHETTGRVVAVKVLHCGPLADDAERTRLRREVQALAAIRHPNIVTVLDTGVTGTGWHYLVTDFVPGVPLNEYVARRGSALSLNGKLRLFLKIVDAVNAAHLRGIVHRDLKPSNVLVDDEGTPHLLDFGMARSWVTECDSSSSPSAGAQPLTITGQFVGSLPYASPEQADGRRDLDPRSDVYSLGVMLYELVTGRFPYDVTGTVTQVLTNVKHAEPRPPTAAEMPVPLRAVVFKALSKRREDRYESAGELARDVEALLSSRRVSAIAGRYRIVGVAVAFLVLVVGAAAITVVVLQTRNSKNAAKTTALTAATTPPPPFRFDRPVRSEGSCLDFAACADMNGDGFVDLIVGRNNDSVVCAGLGDGSFVQTVTGGSCGVCGVGDADGDGRPDFVTTGTARPMCVVYSRPGGKLETKRVAPEQSADRATLLDVNGDGRADVIDSTPWPDSKLELRLSDPTGAFHVTSTCSLPASSAGMVAGDFNGDGRPDLVFLTAHGKLEGKWFTFDASGARGHVEIRAAGSVPGTSTECAAAGDLNGDKFDDLVVARANERAFHVVIARHDTDTRSTASLEEVATVALPASRHPTPTNNRLAKTIAVSDFNGDGRKDVVVGSGAGPEIYFFPGRGDGTFAEPTTIETGLETGIFAMNVADLNNDGRPDVVVGDTMSQYASALLNRTPKTR